MEQLSLDIEGIATTTLTDRQTDSRPQTLEEKVEEAKKTLKLAAEMSLDYYKQPIIVCYSGGKDSDVLLHLAELCLKPEEFEVKNSHTTVDAPETVYHIREVFKRLNQKGIKTTIDYHKNPDGTNTTMWNLIIQRKMPPTRLARYCCQVLKESGTPNRIAAVGVRAAESVKRQGRDVFSTRGNTYKDTLYFSLEHAKEVYEESKEIQDENWDCNLIKNMKNHKEIVVNPIYYWEDGDIWDYIAKHDITTNPLYERGYKRVGCIGCPLATYKMRIKEFADYPKFKVAYKTAFKQMLEKRKSEGKDDTTGKWKDEEAVFEWWIEEGKYNIKGQMSLFEEDE